MLFLLLFSTGALQGSFLALAIERFQPDIPGYRFLYYPPSSCCYCHRRLPWFTLVPLLSFVLLRGHCHYCQHRLPARLFLYEAGTGMLSMCLYLMFPEVTQWLSALLYFSLLCMLAAIDQRFFLLPDRLVFLTLWSGLLCAPIFPHPDIAARIAGVCSGYLALFITNQIFRYRRNTEGIGGGDMKLLAAIGAWSGWQSVAPVIIIASLLGLVSLLCQGRLRKSLAENIPLPFGMFLAIAGWLCFLFPAFVSLLTAL